MKTLFCIILLLLTCTATFSQNTKRWNFSDDRGIHWNVKPHSSHSDHIEMSGLQISAIVQYGVSESGLLEVNKKLVFPMLRTIPNNTHASLIVDFNQSNQFQIVVNGTGLQEYPSDFSLLGKLTVKSTTNTGLETTRILFPSIDKRIHPTNGILVQ